MTDPLTPDLKLAEFFDRPDPAQWRELTEAVLNGAPFEKKLVTKTLEGIAQQPIYDREEVAEKEDTDTTPGEFPYLRGTRASGYRGKTWEVCQGLPYPTPEAFNAALLEDLGRGQDSVLLHLDENGRHGCEPGDTAGSCGTVILDMEDLETALNGVDLEKVPLHIEAGAAAPAAAAAVNRSSITPRKGSICFDPLALLAMDGELPMRLTDTWDLMASQVTWMNDEMPDLRSVGVDVSWSVNAGGNAVQELALMLASAAETFRALAERGVSPDLAAKKSLVRMSIGSDFFMQTAKFRAARGLWAHMAQACGGGEEACKLHLFAATSIWHQTRLDPYVNLLRGTSQAFSAVLGGVDGLRVDPFDAPFGLPDRFSRRIARNIQLILRDEAHLTEVVDPAGGSWTVEHLTRELSTRAWAEFQRIEAAGGMLALLQDGSIQNDLEAQAEKQRELLAQRRMIKVGTNQFADVEEKKPPNRMPDRAEIAAAAREKLEAKRAARTGASATMALNALKQDLNMNTLEAALKHGATLAEVTCICGGESHSRVNPVRIGRLTEGYERLRRRMDAYVAATGSRPQVLMAQMGPVRQYKVRSDFSQEFLKPAGFEVRAQESYDTAEAAAEAVLKQGVAATVICSTDDTYPDLVPDFARAVKASAPDTVVLMAGFLPDHLEAFRAAGVDDFIHLKANNLQMLERLQDQTGVDA